MWRCFGNNYTTYILLFQVLSNDGPKNNFESSMFEKEHTNLSRSKTPLTNQRRSTNQKHLTPRIINRTTDNNPQRSKQTTLNSFLGMQNSLKEVRRKRASPVPDQRQVIKRQVISSHLLVYCTPFVMFEKIHCYKSKSSPVKLSGEWRSVSCTRVHLTSMQLVIKI